MIKSKRYSHRISESKYPGLHSSYLDNAFHQSPLVYNRKQTIRSRMRSTPLNLTYCNHCAEHFHIRDVGTHNDKIQAIVRQQLRGYHGYSNCLPSCQLRWQTYRWFCPIHTELERNIQFNIEQKSGIRCRFCGTILTDENRSPIKTSPEITSTATETITKCTQCKNPFSSRHPKVPGSYICQPCVNKLVEDYI